MESEQKQSNYYIVMANSHPPGMFEKFLKKADPTGFHGVVKDKIDGLSRKFIKDKATGKTLDSQKTHDWKEYRCMYFVTTTLSKDIVLAAFQLVDDAMLSETCTIPGVDLSPRIYDTSEVNVEKT